MAEEFVEAAVEEETLTFAQVCREEPFEIMKKYQSENEISERDYAKGFEICCVNGYKDQAEWILKLGKVEIPPYLFRKIAENSQYEIIHWLLDKMDLDKHGFDAIWMFGNTTLTKILLERLPKINADVLRDIYSFVKDIEFLAFLYKTHPIDLEIIGGVFMKCCINGNLECAKILYEMFKFDSVLLTESFYYTFSEMNPSHDVVTWLLSIDKIDNDLVNKCAYFYRDKDIEILIRQGYVAENKVLVKRYTEYARKRGV
ncbi:MAG: hypothetical protein Harvfovirus19_9 [Harvfovirus sp.]|uniref:Ankyrin repeat protein n=1 Tax=Harvfovirus sp. TaxID=2487768 RepID=A0A3G5A3V5_9VIRU|nr:MAG: hypothetical protein Harvfovirus19_9 [Harvfovirus sp.]